MTKRPVIVRAALAAWWLAAAIVAGPRGLAKEATGRAAGDRSRSVQVAPAPCDRDPGSCEDRPRDRSGRLLPGASKPRDIAGLQNFLQVTDRIYSGGQPQGRAAFERLAEFGVRTVVSVDGARPDVAAATAAGLQYVHIPMGYDGVSSHAGRSLAQLVRSRPGPYYIHCHHGRHRGPAAAAVAAVAADEAAAPEIGRVLEAAGVSRNYAGLRRDAAAYRPPPEGTQLPELAAVAEVDSVAGAMARIDRYVDHLERFQAAGWQLQPERPDVVPRHEALLTREAFRELARLSASTDQRSGRDQRLLDWMEEAESAARNLERSLASDDHGSATRALEQLRDQCTRCHQAYRD